MWTEGQCARGWQINLEKGDVRKRKHGEQAERRQVDRDKEI